MVISFQLYEFKKEIIFRSHDTLPLFLHAGVEAWYVNHHPGSPTKKILYRVHRYLCSGTPGVNPGYPRWYDFSYKESSQ